MSTDVEKSAAEKHVPTTTPPIGDDTSSPAEQEEDAAPKSAFKSLGWLDRYLAVWILLAMIIGVVLGNFVPNIGPALNKGKFVDVSVPIGESFTHTARKDAGARPSDELANFARLTFYGDSHRSACHDVPHPVPGPVRNSQRAPPAPRALEADHLQRLGQLDSRSVSHGELDTQPATKSTLG